MRHLVTATAFLLFAGPALAQNADTSPFTLDSGNNMLTAFAACDRIHSHSSEDAAIDEGICMHVEGYIDGAIDTQKLVCAFEPSCAIAIPKGVTNGQAYDVVRKYLVEHPENRQELPMVLIGLAVAAAWPKATSN